MSKSDNLNDYLADLYQGIASKKPGASKNPQDFRSEIESIKPVLQEKTATANGDVVADEGYDGLSKVKVAVPETPIWDGTLTKTTINLTGTTWNIPSGWVTVANQGNYLVDGELTLGGTTVAITQLILGLYSPASGTPEYKANWLSIMVDGALQTLESTSGFTLKITGGKDASNADLLAWLESDGQDTGVSLISFTIAGTTYQAISGMTWGEWVADTNYNTDGYYINGEMVCASNGQQVLLKGAYITAGLEINEDDYTLSSSSSGGS